MLRARSSLISRASLRSVGAAAIRPLLAASPSSRAIYPRPIHFHHHQARPLSFAYRSKDSRYDSGKQKNQDEPPFLKKTFDWKVFDRLWPKVKTLLKVGAVIFLSSTVALVSQPMLAPDSVVRRALYEYLVVVRALIRLLRDVKAVVAIVADYTLTMSYPPGPGYELQMQRCHERCALRLRDVMLANGGLYIKFGQHISQMQYLMPDAYVQAMQVMLNKAPTSSWDEVRRVVVRELGAPPEELFAAFDPKPIASASLAQVHEAVTKDGVRVAVKIQHEGLREACHADLITVSALVKWLHRLFPAFDYNWLVEEASESLPLELDFTYEARNAEKCARNFRHLADVVVPSILWPMTTSRVLTMEFMEGAHITDTEALHRMSIQPETVSSLLSHVFSQQMFVNGFVHCDPHPGNVMIQRDPRTSRPRLILLDHGLYKQISPEMRTSYAHLWGSIIMGDANGIAEASRALGAGELYPLFASILTRKTWDEIRSTDNHLAEASPDKHRLQKLALDKSRDIQSVLAMVPRPVILLIKTNDILRSIDHYLGTPTTSIAVMARYCLRVMNSQRRHLHPGLRTEISILSRRVRLEIRLGTLQTFVKVFSVWHSFWSWLGGLQLKRVLSPKTRRMLGYHDDQELQEILLEGQQDQDVALALELIR